MDNVNQLRKHALPLLTLLVLTVLVYHELPTHSFLANWDDQVYVTRNPAIQGFGLQNQKTAFSSYYVGNYAPVQIISYMLDYTLWGLRPAGFLVANVFYHFLCGGLLYLLLVRHGLRAWGAALGCALFLVHPVQMESVAWVSQRKNLLAMLFFLAAFHAWLGYRRRTGNAAGAWYVAAIALFVLALLAKSVAVIFPLMLVLYDLLMPPERQHLRDHADKIPFLLAACGVGVLAMVSQSLDHGGGRLPYPGNPLSIPLTMLPVLARYLGLLFWPSLSSLSVMYFPPNRSGVDGAVAGSLVLVVWLAALGVYLYRKSRPCLFWYALFFLGLLPVSQIVPLVTLMNDRYLYFPMLGVAGMTAYLFDELGKEKWLGSKVRWAGIAAAVVVALLALVCHERGRVWQDSISLFSDAVAKAPDNAKPWSRLAEGYVAAGKFDNARQCYEKAATFGALDHLAQYNLARIYLESGDYDRAYSSIWKLLLTDSKGKEGQLLLGEYYFRTGGYSEAERQLLAYTAARPEQPHGWFMLGQTYLMLGNYDRAREPLSRAVVNQGKSPGLYLALARLESAQGNLDQGLEYLQTAFRMGLPGAEFRAAERYLANLRQHPGFGPLVEQYGGGGDSLSTGGRGVGRGGTGE